MIYQMSFVHGLTMDYGECIELNGTQYCAPAANVCPNITCSFENCTGYINSGINETLEVCSQTKNITENIYLSLNGSFFECQQISKNLTESQTLIEQLKSEINASANCTGRLNATESSLSVCQEKKDELDSSMRAEKERADTAWSQFYQANIFTFALGATVIYLWKMRPKSKNIGGEEDILEPEEEM